MINTTLSQLRISQNLIPKQSFFDIFFFINHNEMAQTWGTNYK